MFDRWAGSTWHSFKSKGWIDSRSCKLKFAKNRGIELSVPLYHPEPWSMIQAWRSHVRMSPPPSLPDQK